VAGHVAHQLPLQPGTSGRPGWRWINKSDGRHYPSMHEDHA